MYSARVLIVEDEAEWQDIVKELLMDEEHYCYIAPNYDAALTLLKQDSFNVVFLDLGLHEFDRSVREGSGWRLLNYLVENHPRTKIVVLSGRASAGDAVKLMRNYPVAAFIDKSEADVETQIMDAVHQAMEVPSLRIQTFGQFRVWRNGQLVDVWEMPLARTLVKILLTQRTTAERAISAKQLTAYLWNDSDAERNSSRLLPIINSARSTLEPNTDPRDSNFILRSAVGYYFDLGNNVVWDVRDFRNNVFQANAKLRSGDFAGAITGYEVARALYTDDFLVEDQGTAWVTASQRALQTEYRDALIGFAEAYEGLRRYADAARIAEAALKVDPLTESIYRQLMRYTYLDGNKAQALKVYRNCEKLFKELFGEDLNPQTKQLFDLISSDANLLERGATTQNATPEKSAQEK